MENFRYFMPADCYFGRGCIEANKNAMAKLGKKAMVVTGRTSAKKNGAQKDVTAALDALGIVWVLFDEIGENPDVETVERAAKIAIDEGVEFFIGIGGGSPMDLAKALGAKVARPKKPIRKMRGLLKIRKAIPLLIAIPTTAGTGSEVTVAAGITDSETHHKYAISDFCLIPKYAVMSPEVTVGLNPHLTATTGMDALTHAIEAYIGRARTKKTKAASEGAVKLIFENLELAYTGGENLEARKNMLHASYLAGCAFTVSYVGYVHAVAHTLGGKYGIAHGLANAVLLPKILREYGKNAEKRLSELSRAVGLVDANTPDDIAAEAIISHIEGMNSRMQIPQKLDCVVESDIAEMSKLADREANPLYPVPILWNADELAKIYKLI